MGRSDLDEEIVDTVEFEEEADATFDPSGIVKFSDAVLFSTDWTVETILSQLNKQNIQLNPNFQRRDAWGTARKSRFIESIIIGLPIPQLVLAEQKNERGKFLVLDGKQRLLSLLKFTASKDDRKLGFALSQLEARPDLRRAKFFDLNEKPELEADLNSFLNYSIRTVIIRNWPNNEFLYQVFLRLNTGSVKLSPQELRQAMAPGAFSTFVDDYALKAKPLMRLLGRDDPDPRMRDVELLVRHLAFINYLDAYRGRMKSFLDEYCELENRRWATHADTIQRQADEFSAAIEALMGIFGEQRVARKPNSNSMNRAIFDVLAYYAADEAVRKEMLDRPEDVRQFYSRMFDIDEFRTSIESDTAGIPNTSARLITYGTRLRALLKTKLNIPRLVEGRIVVS